MAGFHDEVTRFYRRWDALERALGEGAVVLDFDMAPDVGPTPPYESRDDALRALVGLRESLPPDLLDPAFVDAKLDGAEAYLRALMGQRAPFAEYLRRTMGVEPTIVPASALAEQRARLEEEFAARGIAFSAEGRDAYAARYGRVEGAEVGPALRDAAARYVRRALALLDAPEELDPEYRVEVVREDAYWSNWIDGSASAGVLLRINTHERIEYNRFSAEALAAHEIAGHATHVASLRRGVAEGHLDPCVLNLAVHSCEAFHMEGLAQVALHVLAQPGELDDDLLLLELHRDYVGARMNNAQIAMEDGLSLQEAVAATLRDCPLLKGLSVESSLRDRARDPLFRSYIHVYAPSRDLFLRAAELPEPARSAFFRDAWARLLTPSQLAARLA